MKKIYLLFMVTSAYFIAYPLTGFSQIGVPEKTKKGVLQKPKEEKKATPKEKAKDGRLPVNISGDRISYLQGEGKVAAEGNVKIERKGMRLFCDEAVYDANAHIAQVKGNVKIIREGSTLYGENVIYDFNTDNATILGIRMESPPIYGRADKGDKLGQNKYLFKKGSYITTCNLTPPHYRMVAKKITVYPQERVVARNMFFKVGDVPVFYLPYFSQSLKDEHFPVQVVPGRSKKDFGLYVLNRYRYDINKTNRGKLHFDKYEKRWWAFGLTHWMEDSGYGKALLRTYFIEDKLYELHRRPSLGDVYPGRDSIAQKYLEDDRYKAQLFYEWKPERKEDPGQEAGPAPQISIKGQLSKSSDEYFIKDFFYLDYEIENNPESYLLIDYAFPHFSLSLLTKKRVNRWSSETQLLPELEYNLYNQPLLGGNKLEENGLDLDSEEIKLEKINVYLESKAKFSNLYSKTAHSAEDSDDVRLYLENKLESPNSIRWLYFTPYVKVRNSFHSKDSSGDNGIARSIFGTGIDLTTKLYKVRYVDFSLLGRKVEKIRHIITPKIDYDYIHDPTVPASKVLFDAIGSTRSETVAFSIENKLQMKDDKEKVWDFLYFSPTANYQINQEGTGSRLTTVDTTLEVYPKEDKVSLLAKSTYDNRIKRISSFNLDLDIRGPSRQVKGRSEDEEDVYYLTLGHRYVRQSSTQGTIDFGYDLTPRLRLQHYARYEYNTGDLQAQKHSLRADLHCWWLDFIFEVDKQVAGRKDFSWYFALTLKDFPGFMVEGQTKYYARKIKGRY